VNPPLPNHSPLLIYPTESSYALGCRYNDRAAIRRIMRLKGRSDNRFTLIADSLTQVKQHFDITSHMEQLLNQSVSVVVTDKFAVRISTNPVARELAKQAGVPILATSLNVSGKPPLFDLRRLDKRFADIPRIDSGPLPQRPPSTIVECFRGGYVIHRAGAVKL